MNLASHATSRWLGHGDVVVMAVEHGHVVRVEWAPRSARRAVLRKSAKHGAEPMALRGLHAVRCGAVAACALASCALCRRIFNPLQGPCGCVLCPRCLGESMPSHCVNCSACGPAQRRTCLVRRAMDQSALEAALERGG